ncbi:MAG: hypothetical protein ACJAYB_000048 [Psychromonas sp.]|jgi:hypothetical protein
MKPGNKNAKKNDPATATIVLRVTPEDKAFFVKAAKLSPGKKLAPWVRSLMDQDATNMFKQKGSWADGLSPRAADCLLSLKIVTKEQAYIVLGNKGFKYRSLVGKETLIELCAWCGLREPVFNFNI